MKGNVVPELAIPLAVAAVLGTIVTGITISGLVDMATGADRNSDAYWVEENLGDIITNKCETSLLATSGPTDPTPQNQNISHSFNKLQKLVINRRDYYDPDINPTQGDRVYETSINLSYEDSNVLATITRNDEGPPNSGHPCGSFKINGTKPDGTRVGRAPEFYITNEDGGELKFRVFETHTNDNITLQVRQD